MMTTEQRLAALLSAPAAVLTRVDAALAGETGSSPTPARLLTHSEAARRLAVSRTSVWRMEKDGVLSVVEIRPGVYRVPEAAIVTLAATAKPRPSRRKGGAA